MAVITYEVATDIIIENITVERKYADGVQTAYRLTSNEGYVIHNPELDETYTTPEGETVTNQYYYRQAVIAVRYAPETWTWHAVLENSVPADMIFGNDNPEHEVM
jgi:hypothetical protein